MKALPVDFENRMKNLLGDEFEDYRNSLEEEPVKSFRVNTDKISIEDFNKIRDIVVQQTLHRLSEP